MLEQGGEGREESHCSPVAFTVELRPQDTTNGGSVGFMVPTEQVYSHKKSVSGAFGCSYCV